MPRALLATSVAIVASLLATVAVPAGADESTRPDFVLPLTCGAQVQAFTYDQLNIGGVSAGNHGLAVDLRAIEGRPVLASADGVIAFRGIANGGSVAVVVDHGNGWSSFSGHLISGSNLHLSIGQFVAAGDQVGLVGQTGNAAGPHIHYEQLFNDDEQLVTFDGEPVEWGPEFDFGANLGLQFSEEDLLSLNCPGHPFVDIVSGSFYEISAEWARATGLTTGTTPTMFSPGLVLPRWQMALFLQRFASQYDPAAANDPSNPTPSLFGDISGLSPEIRDAIGWLAAEEITLGVSSTVYAPANSVTRVQMALFLQRLTIALGVDAPSLPSPFADTGHLSAEAQGAIGWLADTRVTTGIDPDTFDPSGLVNRAQMVTFLRRLAGLIDAVLRDIVPGGIVLPPGILP